MSDNFDFSFFDSRLFASDFRPYSCYVIQKYVKGKGWVDVGKQYDDARDAILGMKRVMNAEYNGLTGGVMKAWRVECRTEVPVFFNWNIKEDLEADNEVQ